jgi:hypothetical protein
LGMAVLLSTAVKPAAASLILTISETGFATFTATDVGNTGAISFFGPYGDYQTNFVGGLSDKLTSPTPGAATLQIQSLDVKNLANGAASKPLTITLTDDNYTFPSTIGSLLQLDSSFGGTFTNQTLGDTATFQSFVVSPATTTGLQSFVVPISNPGTSSFSLNVIPVNFTRPAAYTLTNVTTVSLNASFAQANLSGTTTVTAVTPEPMSLACLALAGVGALTRRSRRL